IMQQVGLFDPLINKMVQITQGNVITISIGTVIIATVAHLDGSGASTFLITIPALLPLYNRMKMNPYLLLLLICGSASIMNMVPWAGPLVRAASVLDMDVTDLWRPLIPILIIRMVLILLIAGFLGYREKRRIEKKYGSSTIALDEIRDLQAEGEKPKLLWVNLLLTILVVIMLVWGVISAGLIFLIALCIVLVINFRAADE